MNNPTSLNNEPLNSVTVLSKLVKNGDTWHVMLSDKQDIGKLISQARKLIECN